MRPKFAADRGPANTHSDRQQIFRINFPDNAGFGWRCSFATGNDMIIFSDGHIRFVEMLVNISGKPAGFQFTKI